MKRTILTTAAIAAVILFLVPGVNADDKYFRPSTSSSTWSDDDLSTGSWYNDPDAGDRVSRPSTGDTAYILPNKTCVVDVTDADPDAFVVQSSGALQIDTGKKLTIISNSSVASENGVVLVGDDSYLAIASSLTISGDGSIDGQDNDAEIQIASNQTLTSTTTITGALQIVGDSNAVFDNDGIVSADGSGTGTNTLVCYSGTFDGTYAASPEAGVYEVAGGKMQFRAGVTATNMGARIRITSAGGTLNIDENVSTTSEYEQDGGSTIVAPTKSLSAS
jgi:hypothetical protein